jgi:PKD repeat protein
MKIVHASHFMRVLWIAIFYGISSLLYAGQILPEFAPTIDGTHRQGIFENRDDQGQLVAEAPYFYMIDGVKVFFTISGLRYEAEVSVKNKIQSEEGTQEEEARVKFREVLRKETQVVFVNGNENLSFEPSDVLKGYLLNESNIKSSRFGQLKLLNVWNNIDLIFFIHPKGGLKYSVILKEGSNLEDVQLEYYNVQALDVVANHLVVKTPIGTWLEDAPITTDAEGTEVDSRYLVDNNKVKFDIEGYQLGLAYIIDPWITFFTGFTSYDELTAPMDSVWQSLGDELVSTGLNNTFNRVQMDYDFEGNVYIARTPALFYTSSLGINGYYPTGRFLEKYDADGVLVFIYEIPQEDGYFSDVTVNKETQQVYFTNGPAQINLLSADGQLLNSIDFTEIPGDITEVISMEFDHCLNKLVLGLGGVFAENPDFYGTIDPLLNGDVVTSDGFDISESLPNYIPYNDNVDVTIDPITGEYFFLFLLRNDFYLSERTTLKADPTTLNATIQNSGEELNFSELATHSAGELTFFRSHFESFKASANFLYGTNGDNLVQINKQTAQIVNSITLPNSSLMRSEGIDVDLCGNVYVGTNNRVTVFDANLNQITTIQVQGMPQDIALMGTRLMVATDDVIQLIDIPNDVKPWQTSQVPDSCNACIGQASVQLCEGSAIAQNISFQWLSNGNTEFTQTGLCSGWHSFKISELKNCVLYEYTDSVFVDIVADAICEFTVIEQNYEVCEGECITLTVATSGAEGEVIFRLDDEAPTTNPEFILCPASSNIYQIIGEDGAGELDTANFFIQVIPYPVVDLGTDTTLCFGATLLLNAEITGSNFSWQNGSSNQTLLVNQEGLYSVIVANSNCVSTDSIFVEYDDLIVDLGSDRTICEGESAVLSIATTQGNFLWSNNSTSPSLSVNQTGIYSVQVSNDFCTGIDSVTVNVSSVAADFSLAADGICTPVSVSFQDESVSTDPIILWNWNFGDGAFASGESVTHTYFSPGTYSVSLNVTNIEGCTDELIASEPIEVFISPTASFTTDPRVLFTDEIFSFIDLSTNATQWSWNFGDGTTSLEQNPPYTFSESGTYTAELTVANEYCSNSTNMLLTINQDLIIFIPNAFSPNSDELNETFKPSVFGSGISVYQFRVFNRWGDVVFESNDPEIGWVGDKSERDSIGTGDFYVQDGVYSWTLVVKSIFSTEVEEFSGHVILIR